MTSSLILRDFGKLSDFSAEEIQSLLNMAAHLKEAKELGLETPRLRGKNIALIFEKSSTRTRCAFEVAAYDQGANVTYLDPTGSHIGHKESIKDTARVLGRLYDAIEYRGFAHSTMEQLARHARVPVWNGLTDEYHPTQVLADLLTMSEHSPKPLSDIRFCYLGDASNNMGDSLLTGAAKMGMDVRFACPEKLQPPANLVMSATETAAHSGANILITENVQQAVHDCDFLYTDVWLSMGASEADWSERIDLLKPFQVNADVLTLTGNKQTKFMHCLPALHNLDTEIAKKIHEQHGLTAMEVTNEVFESDASIVFDQAENRLHTIKAVMVATLGT